MKFLWAGLGGGAGLLLGAFAGFAVALAIASLGTAREDGTFGMREMLVGLPAGAMLGLIGGCMLVLRFVRWAPRLCRRQWKRIRSARSVSSS